MNEFVLQLIAAACVREQERLAKTLAFGMCLTYQDRNEDPICLWRSQMKQGVAHAYSLLDLVIEDVFMETNIDFMTPDVISVEGFHIFKYNPACEIFRQYGTH